MQKGMTCGEKILRAFGEKEQENRRRGITERVVLSKGELKRAFKDGENRSGTSFAVCIARLKKHHLEEVRGGDLFCLTVEGWQAYRFFELRRGAEPRKDEMGERQGGGQLVPDLPFVTA